jgi:hypothetical protein
MSTHRAIPVRDIVVGKHLSVTDGKSVIGYLVTDVSTNRTTGEVAVAVKRGFRSPDQTYFKLVTTMLAGCPVATDVEEFSPLIRPDQHGRVQYKRFGIMGCEYLL